MNHIFSHNSCLTLCDANMFKMQGITARYYLKGLSAECAEPEDQSACVVVAPAFQLAIPVDIAG